MSSKSLIRSLSALPATLLILTSIACGGAKVGEPAKPGDDQVPKVSSAQGQQPGAETENKDKNAEPEKIPEGAVRVSSLYTLLGAHYCGATVVNSQKESAVLNVANFSEAFFGLNPLFCNVLRQAQADQSNLVVGHEKPTDPSDKLLDLTSLEFADNAKPEMGNVAFSKCDTGKMGCGSKSVRVIAFSAKANGDAERLCEVVLEVQEEGQRKTIPAYVPWTKGDSNLGAQQSEVQLCSSLALAKAHGKTLETVGTLERPGGLLSDQYRLYLMTLN